MAGRSDIQAGAAYVRFFTKGTGEVFKGLAAIRKKFEEVGKSATSLGRNLFTAAAAAAVPLALASKTFSDFDDQMRAVKGVTGASGEEFKRLTDKAKALGAATSFTAIEVGSLMVELGRAGFKPDQIDEMTGAVLSLARATGTDATLSAGIMSASIRQFSLGATDAARVSDALTAAANKSFNTVETLGEALSYAGPVAADFGMTIEETLAILGGLGNVGIQGSNAGTAVRRLLTLNAAEAQQLNRIFKVSFKDAKGNARPLVDALEEVNEKTKNMGTATRAKKFNEAFGLLGITGASAISKNTVSIRELLKEIQNAGGIADKTAAEMDAGLGGSLRIMWSAVEGVGIAIGESLSKPLSDIVNVANAAATALNNFIAENREIVVNIAAGVAAVAAVGGIIFTFGLGLQAIAYSMAGIGAALALVGTVFSVALSPLGLLIGGVVLLITRMGDLRGKVVEAFAPLAKFAKEIGKEFGETWKTVVDAVASGDLAMATEVAVAAINLAWTKFISKLKGMWTDFTTFFSRTWDEASSRIAVGFIELGREAELELAAGPLKLGSKDEINARYDQQRKNLTVDKGNREKERNDARSKDVAAAEAELQKAKDALAAVRGTANKKLRDQEKAGYLKSPQGPTLPEINGKTFATFSAAALLAGVGSTRDPKLKAAEENVAATKEVAKKVESVKRGLDKLEAAKFGF